jgi:hypothetical protein
VSDPDHALAPELLPALPAGDQPAVPAATARRRIIA